jgi:protein phosphatase 1G
MGASLVYLSEPITEIDQEEGSNNYLRFVTASMQGWRLNMEDSHLAEVKFMDSDQKALFGVFDGHGGREVAVYCKKHYSTMLEDQKKVIEIENVQEWLR